MRHRSPSRRPAKFDRSSCRARDCWSRARAPLNSVPRPQSLPRRTKIARRRGQAGLRWRWQCPRAPPHHSRHRRMCRPAPWRAPNVKRRDISNMHVRPSIQSAADITRDARCLGLPHQCGNLDALRRRSQRIAVDHRIADHHRSNTRSRKYQPIDCHASRPFRAVAQPASPHQKYASGWLAHGEIGDDAAAARMNEGFAGTG